MSSDKITPPFTLSVPEAVAQLRAKNGAINAYVNTREEDALAEAKSTRDGPLSGVPYGLKDEWDTIVLPTTAGSYRHRDRRPTEDHPVYTTFHDAGAILVGKTNLSDMGLAPEATNHIVGATANPFDNTRTAGGSSGGAAAAVAAGMQSFDWGTDIGGSIRMPAAFCGVLGLRLSSATWPITDLFPALPKALEWMCGQGPITKTVAEMRAVLDAASPLRRDVKEAFHPKGAVVYAPDHSGRWPTFVEEVRPILQQILGDVLPCDSLPGTNRVRTIYSSLWASHLDALVDSDPTLTMRQSIGAVLSSLVLRGAFGDKRFHTGASELLMLMSIGKLTIFRNPTKALKRAEEVRAAFEEIWSRDLVIVSPVCMFPAPKIGRSNYNTHLLDCTMPGNIADSTALSIPFGRFDHLPRSIQLMGPPGSESVLLELADRFIMAT